MPNTPSLPKMQQAFAVLIDPRRNHTKHHELIDILMIAVCCCLLCGGSGFVHMEQFGRAKLAWLRTFLALPHGIPSHDTFHRVFSLLDPQPFATAFLSWTQSLRTAVGAEIVALDGKTVRRSFDRAKGRGPIHWVSAWGSANRLVLGQLKTADKSNETCLPTGKITAVPELLRALELAGCIVTVDALNCQKNIAKEIHEADAEYVLMLKANHGTAYEEVRRFLADARQRAFAGVAHDFVETVDKEHGRFEVRRYWKTEQIGWFADRAPWEKLCSGARPLGYRKPTALGAGRATGRGRLPSSDRARGGEHGDLAQDRPEPVTARHGHQSGHLRKQLKAAWDHAYLQSVLKP